ncbi:MAG TPA: hypothetical protein VGZ25_06855 [Gemmataceae bacterium]|nr:hypothetical protein [Gemmataceae bacterium]
MKPLTPIDLDDHDWAGRASEALGQAKKLAPGIEEIRSPQKSRTTSHCRRHEQLADGERACGWMHVAG